MALESSLEEVKLELADMELHRPKDNLSHNERRALQCRSKGNITGGARERRRREPLGGSGGMLPQKILKARGLEMLFPAFSKSDM